MSTAELHTSQLAEYNANRRAMGLAYLQGKARAALPLVMAIWIFSGGFVFIEPSPYEFMFLLVFPVALAAGFAIYRQTISLFVLLVGYVPFAVIAAFQPKHVEFTESLIYVVVTIFLWVTAFYVANHVAESPFRRLRNIHRAYLAVAVIAALIGTLAYLGLMPNAELFLRYDRAKATFQDPNVYGPFLILPAMYCLQRILLSDVRRASIAAILYGILFVGVFVSFSRAAWGHLAFSSLLVYALIYALETGGREKVRMLLLALFGLIGLVAIMAALLSIESVRTLFLERFSLVQNYDTGATGRFGRLYYALELAINHPWGLGPNEFATLRIVEDPHNTYIKVILTYGWLGGFAFISMMLATLWRGISFLAIPSPNRLLLIPLVSVFAALVLEAAIIDIDHWRHFFLITGLIWGITATYHKVAPEQARKRGRLI